MSRLLRTLTSLAALTLSVGPGCILSAEDCGETFVFEAGRCVPAAEDDAETPDLGPRFDGGGFDPDAFGPPPDDATSPRPDWDASLPEDPWAPMFTVLIVDRTPDSLLGESPSTPGCDLDGVRVLGDGLDISATKLLASLRFDPFDQSIGVNEMASLGRPEQTGAPDTFVSLGGGGAYQLLYLEPQRPFHRGDQLIISEYLEPRDFGDNCGVWLCHTDFVDLSACLWVGEGRGGNFPLP